LYLYLPPHSAHPPSVLRGLVNSRLSQALRLTSSPLDRQQFVKKFYQRLLARGYHDAWLRPIFGQALRALEDPTPPTTPPLDQPRPFYLHVHYHPADPPSSAIQRLFRSTVHSPPGEPPLPALRNLHNIPLNVDRLTVAYHRPPNLANLLAPRKIRTHPGAPVSAFLSDDTRGAVNPDPKPG
jgi:hypothetical protein